MLLWVSIRSLFCNHTHFSPTTQNITVDIHRATTFIRTKQSFHICHSEYVFQMSFEEYHTCFLQLLKIDWLYWHILASKDQPYHEALTVILKFYTDSGESLLWWFCDQKILLQKRCMFHSLKCYFSTSCYEHFILLFFRVIWIGVGSLFFPPFFKI